MHPPLFLVIGGGRKVAEWCSRTPGAFHSGYAATKNVSQPARQRAGIRSQLPRRSVQGGASCPRGVAAVERRPVGEAAAAATAARLPTEASLAPTTWRCRRTPSCWTGDQVHEALKQMGYTNQSTKTGVDKSTGKFETKLHGHQPGRQTRDAQQSRRDPHRQAGRSPETLGLRPGLNGREAPHPPGGSWVLPAAGRGKRPRGTTRKRGRVSFHWTGIQPWRVLTTESRSSSPRRSGRNRRHIRKSRPLEILRSPPPQKPSRRPNRRQRRHAGAGSSPAVEPRAEGTAGTTAITTAGGSRAALGQRPLGL